MNSIRLRSPRAARLLAASLLAAAGCSSSAPSPTTGSATGSGGTSSVTSGTGGSTTGTSGCPDGETDCGGTCVDLLTNPAHCGACSHSSGSAPCKDGAPSCPQGQAYDGAACIDILSDRDNCGAVGHVCAGASPCGEGKCLTLVQSSSQAVACDTLCAQGGKQCVRWDGKPAFKYDCNGVATELKSAQCDTDPLSDGCVVLLVSCYCG